MRASTLGHRHEMKVAYAAALVPSGSVRSYRACDWRLGQGLDFPEWLEVACSLARFSEFTSMHRSPLND